MIDFGTFILAAALHTAAHAAPARIGYETAAARLPAGGRTYLAGQSDPRAAETWAGFIRPAPEKTQPQAPPEPTAGPTEEPIPTKTTEPGPTGPAPVPPSPPAPSPSKETPPTPQQAETGGAGQGGASLDGGPTSEGQNPEKAGGSGASQGQPESDGQTAGGTGGQPSPTPARIGGNLGVTYPIIARERGYEGTVVVDVEVGADGRPGAVRVKKGSGHEILDSAALDAAKSGSYLPATNGGLPIDSSIEVSVTFRLSGK